ncbi:MAG: cytochrome c3 family protein [Planctomycetota bacterium]
MLFGKWMNAIPTVGAIGSGGAGFMVVVLGWYYLTPDFFEVGYMPTQPGEGFNHQLHAGELGVDCRYCHYHIEESPEANIPHVGVCYGCHAETRLKDSEFHKVEWVREAYAEDASIPWRRVHKLPDYVRNFPHHVHLKAGVSCYSCHGQIMAQEVVHQEHGLGMGWCLDCHRNPTEHLVPPEKVTDLTWVEQHLKERRENDTGLQQAELLLDALHKAPPQNCTACHH